MDIRNLMQRLRQDRIAASQLVVTRRAAAQARVTEFYKLELEKRTEPLHLESLARDVEAASGSVGGDPAWSAEKTNTLMNLASDLRLMDGVAHLHGWGTPQVAASLLRFKGVHLAGPSLVSPQSIEVECQEGASRAAHLDGRSLGVFKTDEGAKIRTWGRTGVEELGATLSMQMQGKHEAWRTATPVEQPLPLPAAASQAEVVAHVSGFSTRTYVRMDVSTAVRGFQSVAQFFVTTPGEQDIWCGVNPHALGPGGRVRLEVVDDGDDPGFKPPGQLLYLSLRWKTADEARD